MRLNARLMPSTRPRSSFEVAAQSLERAKRQHTAAQPRYVVKFKSNASRKSPRPGAGVPRAYRTVSVACVRACVCSA